MSREELIQTVVESITKCQRLPKPSAWESLGLSHAQVGALFMLFYHNKASVKQLSEHLGISKSAISQLMDPLIDRGLVVRQVDNKDRRVVRLSLSNEGGKTLKKINRLKFAGVRSALNTLNDKELKLMAALHQKVITNITK